MGTLPSGRVAQSSLLAQLVYSYVYPRGVFNRVKIKNVPNWDVFVMTSISTEVRVSVDLHGLGDHGLGAGLVVRGAAVVKSTKTGYRILAGPL